MNSNWPYHISIKYYKRINQKNLKYGFIPDLALKCKFPGCFLESPQNCYNIIYLVYEKINEITFKTHLIWQQKYKIPFLRLFWLNPQFKHMVHPGHFKTESKPCLELKGESTNSQQGLRFFSLLFC